MGKIVWNADSVRKEASKYKKRIDFGKGSSGAYKHAERLGILDEIMPRSTRVWGKEAVIAEGRKYATRKEFQVGCAAAYRVARKNGWLDEIGKTVNTRWTEAKVRSVSKLWRTKKEFQINCPGAYNYASKHEFLDDLYKNAHCPSDNDTIYIWRVVGEFFNGSPVYKIGVTSARLGTRRIKQVAADAGFDYELICCEQVQCKATDIEKKLHILGKSPEYKIIDGYTEFRALSDSALYVAISMICEVVVCE